jgi:hypothetical protein
MYATKRIKRAIMRRLQYYKHHLRSVREKERGKGARARARGQRWRSRADDLVERLALYGAGIVGAQRVHGVSFGGHRGLGLGLRAFVRGFSTGSILFNRLPISGGLRRGAAGLHVSRHGFVRHRTRDGSLARWRGKFERRARGDGGEGHGEHRCVELCGGGGGEAVVWTHRTSINGGAVERSSILGSSSSSAFGACNTYVN